MRFVNVVVALLIAGCTTSGTEKSGDGGAPPSAGDGAAPAPVPTTAPAPAGWRAAVGLGGIVVQTFDEKTWETRQVATGDLYGVACTGNQIGWAVGPAGAVVHTVDGGKSWAPQASHLGDALRAVHFGDERHGAVAGDHGALAVTTDGGATWTPISTAATGISTDLRGVAVADDVGLTVVVGDGGAVLRSTDGASFARVTVAGAGDLQAVSSDDGGHVVIAVDASGAVWASADGAKTFAREAAPSRVALHAVSVHPWGTSAVAAGDGGFAMTRDAAGEWTATPTGTTATLRAALVPYDDGAIDYVAGDHGTLLGRPRGLAGAAFAPIATSTTADLYGLEDL